jgi:ankyrin repeat protein
MSAHVSRRKQRQQEELEKKLYFAICDNDVKKLEELIQDGMDVNKTFYGSNQWQKTAMHLCCEKGHLECARLLYEAGANIEQQDAWFHNPLMYSIFTERSDMVRFLLERGCDADEHDRLLKCVDQDFLAVIILKLSWVSLIFSWILCQI